MEINFVNGFELTGEDTTKYNGKLTTKAGTSFLNTLNNIEKIESILETYKNKCEKNTKEMDKDDLLDVISNLNKDLLKVNVDAMFINVISNILYERNIEYIRILTYEKFAFSLIEILNQLLHSEVILNIHFKYKNQKELLWIEIPACTIYQSYLDNKNNIIQINEEREIDKKTYYQIYNTVYKIKSVEHYFSAYFKYFLDNKIRIKKCENCGKYFIPSNRTDEKYCDNSSPQNPRKTCKEYGAKKTYRDKIKSNDIRKEHYNTSQYYRMKLTRCTDEKAKVILNNKFEKYKSDYEKNKKKYNNKKITEIEFVNWIKEQKDLKKCKNKK